MNEKPVKVDIDFNEALRRIAQTPKGVVVDDAKQEKPTKKARINAKIPSKTKG